MLFWSGRTFEVFFLILFFGWGWYISNFHTFQFFCNLCIPSQFWCPLTCRFVLCVFIKILSTYYRDSTTKMDIVGPYWTSHNVHSYQQLYRHIIIETVQLFHECGITIIQLMGDCATGKILKNWLDFTHASDSFIYFFYVIFTHITIDCKILAFYNWWNTMQPIYHKSFSRFCHSKTPSPSQVESDDNPQIFFGMPKKHHNSIWVQSKLCHRIYAGGISERTERRLFCFVCGRTVFSFIIRNMLNIMQSEILWGNIQFYEFLGKVAGDEHFNLAKNPVVSHAIGSEMLILAFDPAHVLKIGRNICFGSQFKNTGGKLKKFGGAIAWDYVAQCYESDKKNVKSFFT